MRATVWLGELPRSCLVRDGGHGGQCHPLGVLPQVGQLYNKSLENYEESKNPGRPKTWSSWAPRQLYNSTDVIIYYPNSPRRYVSNISCSESFGYWACRRHEKLMSKGHRQDIEIHGCAVYPREMVWPLAPRWAFFATDAVSVSKSAEDESNWMFPLFTSWTALYNALSQWKGEPVNPFLQSSQSGQATLHIAGKHAGNDLAESLSVPRKEWKTGGGYGNTVTRMPTQIWRHPPVSGCFW